MAVTGARIPALDGIRGLMAVVVMLWHGFLIVIPVVAVWVRQNATSPLAHAVSLIDPDILTQAIVVFFLVSGFVVSMPLLREDRDWRRFYASRLLRLYLPAWGAIALSVLLILAVPRSTLPPGTWLADTNATRVTLGEVLSDASLMSQRPLLDNPLWSLTWEVLFSLLLPLYVLVARLTRPHWLWAMGAVVLMSALSTELRLYPVAYMLSFLIGAIAAANAGKVMRAVAAIRRSSAHTLWWWLLFAGSLFSIGGYRLTQSLQLEKPFTLINHVLASTTVVGYTGFLFLSVGAVSAERFFCTGIMRRSGAISYSLYLIHVPILATLAFAMPAAGGVAVLIGLPLSVVVAIAFARWVEHPAHRFARRAGLRAAAATALRRRLDDESPTVP